ncbi:VOC family protein [Laceyella putida]|uniref:VOC family protein n=1 Tax=Laceyella putida TaxID=110101 RepID=A0ABW2RJC0_9BACL
MAIRKIEHVGVMVKDMDASLAFYQEVVGMKLLGRVKHNDEALELAFLGFPGAGETQLELIQGYNDQLPAEGKVHHIAFTVDDIEKEWDRLKQLNVAFNDEEITTLSIGRYFFVYGPDGEWIEFFEPKK